MCCTRVLIDSDQNASLILLYIWINGGLVLIVACDQTVAVRSRETEPGTASLIGSYEEAIASLLVVVTMCGK